MKSNYLTRITIKLIKGSTYARFSRFNVGRIRKLDNRGVSLLQSAINKMIAVGKIEIVSVDFYTAGECSVIYEYVDTIAYCRVCANEITEDNDAGDGYCSPCYSNLMIGEDDPEVDDIDFELGNWDTLVD